MENIIVNIAIFILLVGLVILVLCLTKVINCGGTSKAASSLSAQRLRSSSGKSIPDCNLKAFYKAGGCDNKPLTNCYTSFGKTKSGMYTYCDGPKSKLGEAICWEGTMCDFGYTTKCKGVKAKYNTLCSNFSAADCDSDDRCTCGEQKCTAFPAKAFCSVDGSNKDLKKCVPM